MKEIDDLKRIGTYIRQIRQSKLISMEALAKKAGVGLSTLCAIENGSGNPSFTSLTKVAKSLGLGLVCCAHLPKDSQAMKDLRFMIQLRSFLLNEQDAREVVELMDEKIK